MIVDSAIYVAGRRSAIRECRGGRYERGEWKVPVPGLGWDTETPDRRFTLLNSERGRSPLNVDSGLVYLRSSAGLPVQSRSHRIDDPTVGRDGRLLGQAGYS